MIRKNITASIRTFLFLMLLGIGLSSTAQNDSLVGPAIIEKYIEEGNVQAAKTALEKQVTSLSAQSEKDTLAYYTRYYGSYTLSGQNWDTAIANASAFVEELKTYDDPLTSAKAIKELAWIYDEAGQPKQSYSLLEEALTYAREIETPEDNLLASIQYNMGYYASVMGDFPRSKKNYQKSLRLLQESKDQDLVFYQQVYNALGGVMWFEAKMDSCQYYFGESLKVLAKMDTVPINKYYRPALLQMNLAIVANNMGNNSRAIEYSKEAINNFGQYVTFGKDEQKKRAAKKSQLAAVDNLGVFYNSVGEFSKAEKIIDYSYNQKLKDLEPDDPNILISRIILAQAKINTYDLEGAEQLLLEAIKTAEQNPGSQLYWYSSAYISLAKVNDLQGRTEEAKKNYIKGEQLSRENMQGTYSKDFIDELTDMATFFAKIGDETKAESLINEIYGQIQGGDLKNTVQDFISTTAIARAYFSMQNYEQAIAYSDKIINFDYTAEQGREFTTTDSILVQFSKPIALLVNSKSKYALQPNPDEGLLNQLLAQIQEGIKIVEQRKTIIQSHEDISLLISQNNELFDFAKKLRLERYKQTKDPQLLSSLINLHESSLYNRIRSRLNLNQDMAFSKLPPQVVERENRLKKKLSKELAQPSNFDAFFNAQQQWNAFTDSLQSLYPRYYKMRYATVEIPLGSLSDKLADKTVIRYLFIDKDLFAFVASKDSQELIALDATDLQKSIALLAEDQQQLEQVAPVYLKLYNQLWKPLADKVNTEKVVIIPDAELFNLSFETLTKERIGSFKDLATYSLLSSHQVSYNYSLLLLDDPMAIREFGDNYIAFAPEFSDAMKQEYMAQITDSVSADAAYLQLLPQPFSAELVKENANHFDGALYLNQQATKAAFMQKANEYKIIHIATHAESNNVSPQLSRLIFAKDEGLEENSLYTYEIYNLDLNSDLAVLTACETGKPSYQAGEGMISLAHAFNYAGSKSILTSLWNIDEKTSTELVANFYNYLDQGHNKSAALRLAKLDYLNTKEGRLLAPNYWAGMVLLGDTTPIAIAQNNASWLWYLALLLFIIGVGFWYKRVKQSNDT